MIQVKGLAQVWHVVGFGRASQALQGIPFLGLFSEDSCALSSHSQLSKPLLLSEPQFPYVHGGPSTPRPPSACSASAI